MALSEKLPIYRDTYRLLCLLHPLVQEFPKYYKYSLGVRMADLALDMVILVYKINSSQDKLEPINEFMYRYRSFVVLMRLCVEQHVVSIRKYAEIACLLESISRQATGWKQYIEGQNKKQ